MGSSKAERRAKAAASKNKAKKRKADEITKEHPADAAPSKSADLLAGDEADRPRVKRERRSRDVEKSGNGTNDDHTATLLANGQTDGAQEEGGEEEEAKNRKQSDDQDASMMDVPDDGQTPATLEAGHKESFRDRCRRQKRERKLAKRQKRLAEKEAESEAQKAESTKDDNDNDVPMTTTQVNDADDGPPKKRSRKEKRAERKSKKDAAEAEAKGETETTNEQAEAEIPPTENGNTAAAAPKNHRFIVFVGNLPYSATTKAIKAHFASVDPVSVRHLTHKDDPKKSKGFAFLEFDVYDKMETCLRNFHHSRFEDGTGGGRKINVELTAGGGGTNSNQRKMKLKTKNEKLNEERKNRAEKIASEGGGGDGGGDAAGSGAGKGTQDNVHPSRRSRVLGA